MPSVLIETQMMSTELLEPLSDCTELQASRNWVAELVLLDQAKLCIYL